MLRTFLALDFAAAFSSELQGILPLLQQKIPGVQWVHPEQVHLTLHFFGPTAENEIPRIAKLVAPLASENSLFRVSLRSVGFFPDFRNPRIVWLGVEGDTERLFDFQGKLAKTLSKNGYAVEKRAFVPHVTVGRLKAQKIPLLSELKLPEIFTPFKSVDHLTFFKSTLTPQGPLYETLQKFPFSQKPPAVS